MLPYCVVQAFSRSKKELRPPPPVRLKGRSQAASVAVIEPSQQCTHRFVLSSLLLLLVLLLFTGFSCLGVVCFVSAFTRVLPLRGQTGYLQQSSLKIFKWNYFKVVYFFLVQNWITNLWTVVFFGILFESWFGLFIHQS